MSLLSKLSAPAQALALQIQNLFGADNVTFTSGLRDAVSNSGIPGASKSSDHLGGNAFDFIVSGMSPQQVQSTIANSGIPFGQSIQEYGLGMGPRNHLSIPGASGHLGQLLTGKNGSYNTTGYANTHQWAKADGESWGDYLGRISTQLNQSLPDPLTAASNGVSSVTNAVSDKVGSFLASYATRAALIILAILLLAGAIFSISRRV